MKKIIALLVSLLMLLALLSCNDQESNQTDSGSEENNATDNTATQENNATDNTATQENNATDNTAPEEKPSKEAVAKALADALESKIKVHETYTNKMNYLKDCLTPYQGIPLAACENLSYTCIDMDGDSYDELVIDCGDTMLLRYFEGKVYLYRFSFRALYNLMSDGSYSWSNGGALNYGEDRMYFEGTELKTKEVWSIVKDGEPDAEYYIEGKQVTGEEILKYFDDPSVKEGCIAAIRQEKERLSWNTFARKLENFIEAL